MDINLYRRHSASCRHRAKGPNYMGCQCPIWAYIPATQKRISTGLREIGRALKRVEAWEQKPEMIGHPESPTLSHCVEAYLAECKVRKLAASTIRSYQGTLDALEEFIPKGFVNQVTVDELSKFRASRPGRGDDGTMSASSTNKEHETLKGFCKFCASRGWLPGNPAKAIERAEPDPQEAKPFTAEEIAALLDAVMKLDNANKSGIERARLRARALLLTLLYTGFRISDVAQLDRSRVDGAGKLLVRIKKTKRNLYLPLHADCLAALAALPRESRYYFWSGESKLSTCVGSLRRTIEALGRLSGIHAHPHRFRDTFACRLLEQGVDIRTVQILLGHSSVQTTEKHYAAFRAGHQKLVDTAATLLQF